MYNWWLQLRRSDIPKSKWKILDAVFFLFINQISCICNSYIIYGIIKNKDIDDDLRLLHEYIQLLDKFYISGGEYELLIDTHIAFCYWFQHRFGYDNKQIYLENTNQTMNINKIFNHNNNNYKIKINITRTSLEMTEEIISQLKNVLTHLNRENNFSLILFTSYVQNPQKFISLYSIPVITAVGIPFRVHNQSIKGYSPFSQIGHDILGHSIQLTKYLILLYVQQPINDINIFRDKMIFLQLLYNKRNSDAQILLWFIVHELDMSIGHLIDTMRGTYIKSFNGNLNKNKLDKIEQLRRNILFIHITQNILFSFDFMKNLIKQLQTLKIVIESLITSEEKRNSSKRVINSIDALIENYTDFATLKQNNKNFQRL